MAPGVKTGGRKKGVPNKVTAEARSLFQSIYEGRLDDLDRWIKEAGDGYDVVKLVKDENGNTTSVTLRAGKDPGKAADLLLRMAEHFTPKLGRMEHTGKDGGSITIEVVKHP